MDINNEFKQKINSLTDSTQKREVFNKLSFKTGWNTFSIKNKKAYFVSEADQGFNEDNNDVIVNKVKLLLKKKPWIFSIIYNVMVPVFAKNSAKKVIKSLPENSTILNLGSGVSNLHPSIINIDFYAFENVDFVADIVKLPFADGTIDGVISECVLEHVPDPISVVSEMHRVLKKGGTAYVIVPFVFSFHSSPNDYTRWTKMGLRHLFKDFDEVDSGVHFGPGNAANWILAEFFGTLLSFGSKQVHSFFFMVFLVLLCPLNYLDYFLVKIKTSENIASHIYFIGKKK